MKKRQQIYSIFEKASAFFMMLVLFWLTISFSFTYAVNQQLVHADGKNNSNIFNVIMEGAAADCSAPLNIPIEEKAPGGSQLVEEYLHDNAHNELILSDHTRDFKYESVSNYIGFHGELLVPPPNHA